VNILVPLDGSVQTSKALDKAAELAVIQVEDVHIMILFFWRKTISRPSFINKPLKWLNREKSDSTVPRWAKDNNPIITHDYFTELVKKLKLHNKENITVSYTIRAGDIIDEIIKLIDQHEFDLIVFGDRNPGFTSLFSEPPSRILKRRSNVPVKVINPEGEEIRMRSIHEGSA